MPKQTKTDEYRYKACENLLCDLLKIMDEEELPAFDEVYTATKFLEPLRNSKGWNWNSRDVVEWYYGFNDGKYHSYEEVRDILELGVTRERVRQVISKAKAMLLPNVNNCFYDTREMKLEPCPFCGAEMTFHRVVHPHENKKATIRKYWLHEDPQNTADDCVLLLNSGGMFTLGAGDADEETKYVGELGLMWNDALRKEPTPKDKDTADLNTVEGLLNLLQEK